MNYTEKLQQLVERSETTIKTIGTLAKTMELTKDEVIAAFEDVERAARQMGGTEGNMPFEWKVIETDIGQFELGVYMEPAVAAAWNASRLSDS